MGSQPRLWSIFGRAWIGAAWPFTAPRFIGEDLSWDEYLELPSLA